MPLSFLDDLVHYQDPSLPQLSSLAYLYITCLLSAFLVACDFRKKKIEFAEMPEFTSVSLSDNLRKIRISSS